MGEPLLQSFEPRETCLECLRPARVCVCGHVVPLDSPNHVLILQHPRERRMPIGTAHLASRGLSNSTLIVGTHLDQHPQVEALLRGPRPAVLLWPGGSTQDLAEHAPTGPVTLVVVDGTWSLAKKLVSLNPVIAALPRFSIVPRQPSQYRIRREPRPECISTIEAIAHALEALEGERGKYERLLVPFRAMVDAQVRYADEVQGSRHRGRLKKRTPKDRSKFMPAFFHRTDDIVFVSSEANAWPYRGKVRHPDELIHVVASRLDGTVLLDAMVKRPALSPTTLHHVELTEEDLAGAIDLADLQKLWLSTFGAGDRLTCWSAHGISLLGQCGLTGPTEFFDLRRGLGVWMGTATGSLSSLCERLAVSPTRVGRGRAGARLGQVLSICRKMLPAQEDALG